MDNIQITRSPIDDSIYVERKLSSTAEVELIIELAVKSQVNWKKVSIENRAELCHKMIDEFVKNEDEIANQLCWMMGRPIKYARGEVSGMAERARYMIDAAKGALKDVEIPNKEGFTRYIKREPLGVAFIVAPWNFPYLTAINSIIPAIMAGNSVILKHSAQTPLCAEQLFDAFGKVNLPVGVFQYLHISHEITEFVIKSPRINYVGFTGSVNGGKMVERVASGRFIGVGLELGGKDPAYIRADADVQESVDTCIDGAFFNSGQSCCGIERIYVHKSIYDEFVQKAVALVNTYKLGRPDEIDTTLGPVVKASAADFVRQQCADAILSGATAHINPLDFDLDKPGSQYLAPQILTNVNHSMSIMKDESFGPVVGIMKVESDQQAVELMNDSEFGLTASVFTSNIDKGIAIGEQINTGTFFINRCDYLDPALAWTGVKNSGRGCTLSSLGYDVLTRPKSFHIKHQL